MGVLAALCGFDRTWQDAPSNGVSPVSSAEESRDPVDSQALHSGVQAYPRSATLPLMQPWRLFRRGMRLARNLLTDFRYGRFLGGIEETRFRSQGAHATVNSDYQVLHQLFRGRIRDNDVLVDVGCGRGRVLNYWLSIGLSNRIIGLELDPNIAAQTGARLARYRNVQVIAGDALLNLPADGTLFYMYNPFAESLVRLFAERCAELYGEEPSVRFFYANPEFGRVFAQNPRWRIDEELEIPQPWAARPFRCWMLSIAGSVRSPAGNAAP
jgi:hypothetical protein